MLYTDKEKAKEAIDSTEGKLHVIPAKEYDDLLKNFKLTEVETEIEKRIGLRIKEVHDQYDKDLFEVTGLKKEDNEKTYAAYRRILAEYKAKADKKGTDDSEELKNLRKKFAGDIEAKENEIKELKENGEKRDAISTLRTGLSGLKFNESIPESLRKKFIEDTINALAVKAVKNEDGSYRYKDQNGVDITESYKPVSDPAKVLAISLKDIIGEPEAGGGGGGGGKTPNVGSMEAEDALAVLKEEKLTVGTPDHTKRFRELTGIGSEKKEE